jgi:hypothetical protein
MDPDCFNGYPRIVERRLVNLAIVGAEAQTRENAPYDNLDYDIWSFADWLTADWLRRCDAILEVHAPAYYRNHPRTPGYWKALQETDTAVYMCPIADPKVPAAIEYPMDAVMAMLGKSTNAGKKLKPFNCTLAYGLAFGILQEYEVIDVYGVELGGEYSKQSGDFAFWAGFAAGRGITININCSEGMFSHPLYGVEDTTPISKLYKLMQETMQQRETAKETVAAANGALQVLQHLMKG